MSPRKSRVTENEGEYRELTISSANILIGLSADDRSGFSRIQVAGELNTHDLSAREVEILIYPHSKQRWSGLAVGLGAGSCQIWTYVSES